MVNAIVISRGKEESQEGMAMWLWDGGRRTLRGKGIVS